MRSFALTLMLALPLAAQSPAGQPKPRLELADSARRVRAPADTAPRVQARVDVRQPPPPARDTGVGAVRRLFHNSFVRKQALYGLALYGPSFAATVADGGVQYTAAYLVMAGGSFFAAAEIARDMQITDGMDVLSTHVPLQGAVIGAALQYAMTGKNEYAPGIFLGSILGTTGALTLGRRLSTGGAMAVVLGADAAAALAMGTMYAFDANYGGGRTRAAVGAGAGIAGMQLGAMYAMYARYNVTEGDIYALTTSSLIGMAGASAFVANGHPGHKVSTLTALGGALAGLAIGDRLLVRRIDHSPGEGMLTGMAGVAGALMGGGVAVIAGASGRFNAATAGLGAAGAAGGVWLAEHWMGARPDAGRRLAERLSVTPQSLAFAAARLPGTYSLVRFTF